MIDKALHTGRRRVLWVGTAVPIGLVLLTARTLTPDPRGFGTHRQLGLPDCQVLRLTGLPCPACGLTTCFAHLAHGNLRAGLACQPVGVALFALACAALGVCVYAAVRGIAFRETWTRLRAAHVCVALGCALLGQWLLTLARLLLV